MRARLDASCDCFLLKRYLGDLLHPRHNHTAPSAKMSSITIATLPRMTRDVLSSLLLAQTNSAPSKIAVIDVRDSGAQLATRERICLPSSHHH